MLKNRHAELERGACKYPGGVRAPKIVSAIRLCLKHHQRRGNYIVGRARKRPAASAKIQSALLLVPPLPGAGTRY